MTLCRFLLGACIPALMIAPSSGAQAAGGTPDVGTAAAATRVELSLAAEELERYLASTAYSESLRMRARSRVAAIRQRLTDGDFQVGDRIAVSIQGQMTLEDTVTVMTGRQVLIRGFRQVSVAGLLRVELEPLLRTELAEFVRAATITARPLTRVAVFGAVLRPGYVSLPSDATLDQAITHAGGPTATADAARATLMRSDTTILARKHFALAVARGRTLGDLEVRDGDAILVPVQGAPWDRTAALQIVSLFVMPLVTIFVIQRQ